MQNNGWPSQPKIRVQKLTVGKNCSNDCEAPSAEEVKHWFKYQRYSWMNSIYERFKISKTSLTFLVRPFWVDFKSPHCVLQLRNETLLVKIGLRKKNEIRNWIQDTKKNVSIGLENICSAAEVEDTHESVYLLIDWDYRTECTCRLEWEKFKSSIEN